MSAPRLIEDLSDTARWTAYHRALESDRPDALFRDPFARRLAGDRGRRIAEQMPALAFAHPGPRGLTWALAVRTKVFDELILESIARLQADAVVVLAAGLDARPYRLSLPRSLVWFEMDRPSILAAKAEVLGGAVPACRVERVAVDLVDERARDEALARIVAGHRSIVAVAEGLLVYLDEAAVTSLAKSLWAIPSLRGWVMESAAPEVVAQNMKAWGAVLTEAGAAWKFAPADGLAFFGPLGWTPRVVRSCIAEARRLGREEMRHARFLRLLSAVSPGFRRRLEDSVRYALLEPAGSA